VLSNVDVRADAAMRDETTFRASVQMIESVAEAGFSRTFDDRAPA
jgi:hypothetical protein